jgi:hypothetical protein
MAGSLIKIAETTVSSATASVTLTGIDSTYDVYMVRLNNVQGDTDSVSFKERFTVSGTPQSTANYDYAAKTIRDSAAFANNSATNQTELFVNTQTAMGTGTGETLQGVRYLFNFNNASEYSFVTMEMVFRDFDGSSRGGQGGGVYTVAEAHNGVNYFFASGNIASGTFTLYGLKK